VTQIRNSYDESNFKDIDTIKYVPLMLKEFKYLEKNYDFKPSFLKDSSEIELKFFSLEESVLKIMEKKQILEKEKKILEYENEQHIKVNFLKISY